MKDLRRILAAAAMLLCLVQSGLAAAQTDVAIRFAVLGDAEPKPEALFPGVAGAVRDLHRLHASQPLDFVVGVGDIAHKGTLIQYQKATAVLDELQLPFYPIMGNEEHGGSVERYLSFANRWGAEKPAIDTPSYTLEREQLALVFASPDHGRDFDDSGIDWMLSQLRSLAPKPVLLVVHSAQSGVYPEKADKGVSNPRFSEVIAQPNLAAVISGDLHMDMDRVTHSKQIGAVHYLHIPALERTKVPDKTQHTPMFRVFTVFADDQVQVDTYAVGGEQPLPQHGYRFSLRRP